MGFLDRFNRTDRMERFEGRHHLSEEDRKKINAEVKKVYQNILQGYMTRAQGKEHILRYITLLIKTKYPNIDFERTGLANRINRYASMKIRKLVVVCNRVRGSPGDCCDGDTSAEDTAL